MAFTPKFIPTDEDNLDEEPLEDIRVAVVIPEIEEILDERKFVLLIYVYYILEISSFSWFFATYVPRKTRT